MNPPELSADVLINLQWTADKYAHIKQSVHDRAMASRVVRPILPLFGDQTLDPNSIPLYTFDPKTLSIKNSDRVPSVRISRNFEILNDGFGNENIGAFSAERAAEVVAAAEDAVLLHGVDAAARLKTLGVQIDETSDYTRSNLSLQKSLFDAVNAIPGTDLYAAVVGGMTQLQNIYPNSTYCVLVSPALWATAAELLDRSGTTLRSIIEELLRPSGSSWSAATPNPAGTMPPTGEDTRLFRSTRALDGNTGVIFVCRQDASTGAFGGVIDVAVPSDAAISYVSQTNFITLRVEVRVALRLNDPNAAVSFTIP